MNFPMYRGLKPRSTGDPMVSEGAGDIHIAVIDYRKLELECLIRISIAEFKHGVFRLLQYR